MKPSDRKLAYRALAVVLGGVWAYGFVSILPNVLGCINYAIATGLMVWIARPWRA